MDQPLIYTVTAKLRNADVDAYRRLRLSVLFTMFQEAAIAHTEALGMGREKTLDRGLLWIVTLQRVSIRRLPVYDETITLESWPGKTMHLFFPRYFRMLDAAGKVLLEGSALWSLMDRERRSVVFPNDHGISIPGVVTGRETPLPHPAKPMPQTEEARFRVPYSWIDLNGHMNNVRYFDLAEDVLPPELHRLECRALTVDYTSEAKLGEELLFRWGSEGGVWYLTGEAGKRVFRMRLEYAEGGR